MTIASFVEASWQDLADEDVLIIDSPLPGSPHMPGPDRLVTPHLLPLQQLFEGAADSSRVRAPGPLLLPLGLGPTVSSWTGLEGTMKVELE